MAMAIAGVLGVLAFRSVLLFLVFLVDKGKDLGVVSPVIPMASVLNIESLIE